MSDSVCVIIATIGKPTLRRAVESVLNQTYKDVRCFVVVDGEEYYQAATDAVNEGDFSWGDAKRCDVLTLPQNTGANGYVCHRIYAAMPFLVNQDWICYLDDDNWLEPEHIQNCVEACNSGPLDWCFTMRNIWHEGKFLCVDECESVGLWPTWHDPRAHHIDTNCYFFRREVACGLPMFWNRPQSTGNQIHESPDTTICNVLRNEEAKYAMIAKPTVNYTLGSRDISPKPEFFLQGNVEFRKRYDGKLPWESAE